MAQGALDRYLDVVRALPFVRHVEAESTPSDGLGDARLHVVTSSGSTTRIAELKLSHLTQETADRLLGMQARTAAKLIVFAPHVGRALASRFAAANLDFADLTGNCHFEEGDRYYVHIEGRAQPRRDLEGQALRSSAYRVLLALLIQSTLVRAPVRALAVAAGGVSPQTASSTRRRFVEQGLLREEEPYWMPQGHRRALDLFAAGFTSTLAPALTIGRYRARERDVERLEAALAPKLDAVGRWAWGGGGAGARLTGYFRGDRTVVYVDAARSSAPKLASELGLVPDTRGQVTLLESPGPLAYESPVAGTVHPVLAWADLLREHEERASDAAADLFERYLKQAAR